MRGLLLAASLFSAASAQDGDAVLDKVFGPVYVVGAGSTARHRASGGDILLFGDSVRTGPGGVAQVRIRDRGAVLLHEGSIMVLSGDPSRTLLDIGRGEFLIGLKKRLRKRQWFKVRTPAAVAAVRGTLFWGKSDAKKTTVYAGFGHAVEVTAKGRSVRMEAGQTVIVPFGAAPSYPTPHELPPEYLRKFHVDGGLQGLEALVDLPKPP